MAAPAPAGTLACCLQGRPRMKRAISGPVLVAALLGGRAAGAQGTDPAAAQAMFDEAKQLVAAGKLAEACPKFLTSFKLDPKPGSAVNLADCYEKNGQVASAWARYLEAASLAQRAGQAEREQYARQHAATLEPRLSKLVIGTAAALPPGLEVRRDGALVDTTMLGVGVPVDPGKHQVEARAPGKKTWSTQVDAPAGGGQIKVDIPALEDGASSPPAPPSLAPSPGPTPPGQPAAQPPGGDADAAPVPFWGTQRVAGAVVGAVGLAGVIVGSVFGAKASSSWSSAKNGHCVGTECDATGVSLAGDAKSAATISTASFIPGAVALVAGIVVLATAPKAKSPPKVGFALAPTAPRGAVFTFTGEL
jgi:hypothetical protein